MSNTPNATIDQNEESLKDIMTLYVDEKTFILSPFNKELLNKIKDILKTYPILQNIKRISSPQEYKTIIFYLDCLLLRDQNPEDFFILMKYLTTFGDESTFIIKILIHQFLSKNGMADNTIRIKLKFKNSEGLFTVKSTKKEKLPFNSLVQFTGKILNVSIIKKINTKVNYICQNCGIISTIYLNFGDMNKNFKNDSEISHQCDNNNENKKNINENFPKIKKDFSEPIYIRYMLVETELGNITCLIYVEDFNISYLYNKYELMFEGIVKSKPNNDKKNNNTYIKYVNITNIYELKKNLFSFNLSKTNMILNQNKNLTILSNFVKISNKFALCYKLLGISKIDYNNLLFFYYLFSLSNNIQYNLRIHLTNLSKNELSNLENIKNISEKNPKLFKFIDNEKITHKSNKTSLNQENFINYFGNNFLVVNNYDLQYLTTELKNITDNLNSYVSCFDYHSSNKININISNIIYNPNIYNSLFTMSNSFNNNLKGYDIISIINDHNTKNNDPYLANKAILKKFQSNNKIKKRTYYSMNKESQQYMNDEIDIHNINDLKNDIELIDSMTIENYFKQIINETENENDIEINDNDIEIYIDFVNEYINPNINQEFFNDIYFLSEHLKSQFDDLQGYSFFDVNWLSINTMQKFIKLSARIEMRDIVNKEDIIKGYLMTKEFLQQNYVWVLFNKTGNNKKGKGKRAKKNYVIEKLRQYSVTSGQVITVDEIKNFGCYFPNEYDEIIEQLNMEGILLQKGNKQYEITLDCY